MAATADVNGLKIFYRDTGAGEPLLLLHGFTGSGDDWQHVFPTPFEGYRVIAPDLRGHGRSTNPGGSFTFRESAQDIFGLLDRLGIDRVKAIGVSAGANTLLHMATQQPARVDALLHVSGTPRFPEPARAIMRTMTEEGRSPAEWAEMRGRHHHGDDQIRALWRHVREFADDRTDMNFSATTLAAITARTLIVHGDRDPFYPVELALELYRSIPGSALWVVPNGGHGPIFGEQAAPFVAAAAAFLKNK
ncbi:MAG: hydrolase [Acidobacteria bacterium RIFCSPLOWO2_12_FULL_67_14b]|nr:MAG: hydrolase [Acidobacteria bacterium RIFCSPLOWO2_12_FULL_67_14b]